MVFLPRIIVWTQISFYSYLHYCPLHVPSNTMLILRRSHCIHVAHCIVTLYEQSWCSCGRLRLKRDGTRAKTIFRLSAKRTSPFKSAVASVQSNNGSGSVRISGSIAGYTMFRGSVKSTAYPIHSPVSPSFPIPCVTVCHHISTGLYTVLAQPMYRTNTTTTHREWRYHMLHVYTMWPPEGEHSIARNM
jgi:hypothetical protein